MLFDQTKQNAQIFEGILFIKATNNIDSKNKETNKSLSWWQLGASITLKHFVLICLIKKCYIKPFKCFWSFFHYAGSQLCFRFFPPHTVDCCIWLQNISSSAILVYLVAPPPPKKKKKRTSGAINESSAWLLTVNCAFHGCNGLQKVLCSLWWFVMHFYPVICFSFYRHIFQFFLFFLVHVFLSLFFKFFFLYSKQRNHGYTPCCEVNKKQLSVDFYFLNQECVCVSCVSVCACMHACMCVFYLNQNAGSQLCFCVCVCVFKTVCMNINKLHNNYQQ